LDGKVHLLGFGVDISERRLAAAEREKLVAQLKAKNTELEQFTYTVSHDLRSPLITIRGFAGLVEKALEAGDPAAARRDLARVSDASSRMDRLLRELLELSRIGRIRSPHEAAPLAQLAEEAAQLVHGRLRKRGVQLEIRPDLPIVFGERARLVELLQNLLDNAAKFMGSQPAPRIVVGARPGPDGPICYVQDNGIGVAARFRDKIFGIFERLDPGVEGTGVGLAIAKRIVEVHGGRLWVESEGEGRGSSFCFTLPQAPSDAGAAG
jgi:signal transduction histidine kinase